MLRLETAHAAELGRRYAGETRDPRVGPHGRAAVLDRQPVSATARAIDWTRAISGGIRQHDKVHPIVVGTSGQETSRGPFRADVIAGRGRASSASIRSRSTSRSSFPMHSCRSAARMARRSRSPRERRGTPGDGPRDGRIDGAVFTRARRVVRARDPLFRARRRWDRRQPLVLHRRRARAAETPALPAHAAGDRVGHDDVGSEGQASRARIPPLSRSSRSSISGARAGPADAAIVVPEEWATSRGWSTSSRQRRPSGTAVRESRRTSPSTTRSAIAAKSAERQHVAHGRGALVLHPLAARGAEGGLPARAR